MQSLSQVVVFTPTVPGSHCSPAVPFTSPSPHCTMVQSLSQVVDSPPVSHCSLTPVPGSKFGLWWLSPQAGKVQSLSQFWVLAPPSSQSSPVCTTPSPHTGLVQSLRQASVLSELPSSHCSPKAGSVMPSPQIRLLQSVRHRASGASELFPPSSHCSLGPKGLLLSTMSSPQAGATQVVRQRFAMVSLLSPPWSHSSPESCTLSPQRGRLQSSRQASGLVLEFAVPSSQVSFGPQGLLLSMMPSPQFG